MGTAGLRFDVEGVADAVAEEHEGEDEEHDGQAGEEGEVGAVEEDVAVVFFDHGAPGGHGGLDADAEEAEAGFEEDGAGEVGGGHDDDGAGDVGQYVAEDGAEGAEAEGAGGFDVFFFFDAEHLSAHHAGDVDPHGEAHGDEDLPEAFAEGEGDGDDEEDGGDGPDDVDEPGDEVVDPSAVVGGEGAEGDADEECNEDGDEADGEAYAAADHDHAEHVAAVGVGAEDEGACALVGHLGAGHAAQGAVVGCGSGVGFDVEAVACGGGAVGGDGCEAEGAAVEHGVEGVGGRGGLAVAEVGELYFGEGFEGGQFEVLLVAVGGGVGGDEVAEEGYEDEESDDCEACHGEFVAAEATPGHAGEGGAGRGGLAAEEAAVGGAEDVVEFHAAEGWAAGGYMKPSSSLTSSERLLKSHGGSKVSSTLTDLMPWM